MDASTGLLLTSVVGTAATLITLLLHRQWEVQDRQAATTSRAEIVSLIQQTHAELTANTKISTEAFHEANGAKELIRDQSQLLTEEVQRRNELQATADAAARDALLADPQNLAAARVVADLRARLERLERRDRQRPKARR